MKVLNDKKLCFVICGNNDRKLQESLLYIDLLNVPSRYETEILTIRGAESMASAYNEAMNASDARYKVYMHQDVFIVEKNFIEKILKIFASDKKIGMVGMVGTTRLSKDGVVSHSDRYGNLYRPDNRLAGIGNIQAIVGEIIEVEAIEGFLMITNQDIPWREDIFDKWEFYDVAQCIEFRENGYKIVVPKQEAAWTIHDGEFCKKSVCKVEQEKLLSEYADVFAERKELRVLFLNSNKIQINGLPVGLLQLGHAVDIPEYLVDIVEYKAADKEFVMNLLDVGNYDLVVTYNFSRGVSEACKEENINYLAWVYDFPLMQLYTKEALNECNYISVFDRKQKARLEEMGFPHLYYYPLAAEVDAFGAVVISKKDEKRWAADISFVGNLYDQGEYENVFREAEERVKADAAAAVNSTKCIWDEKTSIYGKISDETIQYMNGQQDHAMWEKYRMDKVYFNESLIISRKANEIERIAVLNKLAENHNVVLYTRSTNAKGLKGVKVCSEITYNIDMPKVFHLSKINLNITSRSIESGISQRIWDVMSVGGFMLTNYQPEIEEYFEIGKEIEVFHNLEELVEKVDYYLQHEQVRIRVAMNGYKKIRKYHKYSNRTAQMLKEIFGY